MFHSFLFPRQLPLSAGNRPRRRRCLPARPRLEHLEDRTAPAVFTVTSTLDDGSAGTLRWAVNHANADTDSLSTIDFNIPGSGMQTISLTSALPVITHPVYIDGYSQPGSSPNTLAVGDNAVWGITLDGTNAASGDGFDTVFVGAADGLDISVGGSTVRGLVFQNFQGNGIDLETKGNNVIQGNDIKDTGGVGIAISIDSLLDEFDGIDNNIITSDNNTVGGTAPGARNLINESGYSNILLFSSSNCLQGNYVGVDATGTQAMGGAGGWGISVSGSFNTIGGSVAGAGNVISGNALNVLLGGYEFPDPPYYDPTFYNTVQGNFIGTDAAGDTAINNSPGRGTGIELLDGAGFNLIGGTTRGSGNLISGNSGSAISEASGFGNTFQGNLIGTDVTGTRPIPNGGGVSTNWSDLIGGTTPGAGNTIEFNDGPGVEVSGEATVSGNTIAFNTGPGVQVDGGDCAITANSIYANAALGINLGGSGTPIPNDSQGHTGPNNFQNFPVLSSASSGATTIVTGTLNGAANTTFTVDVYANPTADPSGYGQGQYYLGHATVSTDANGDASFSADFSAANLAGGVLPSGWSVSATATDAGGNTSEFSPDVTTAPATQTVRQYLQATIPQTSSAPAVICIEVGPDQLPPTVIAAVNGLTNVTQPVTIIYDLGGGTYSSGGVAADPPPNVTFIVQNGTLDPAYPALTVSGGQVSVVNCTLMTSGDAPALLVTGGSVTLTNDDIIQSSTAFTDPAVAVTGGTVNLGTASNPGNNTLTVSSSGDLVSNTSGNSISAVGDTFNVGGTVETAPSLSFTSLTSSTASTIPGQPVTLTATVAPDMSGSATPTGSVDFYDTTTSTDLGKVTLSGGIASLSTAALAIGTHVIQASYSGNNNYLPSLASLSQTVIKNVGILLLDPTGQSLVLSGNAVLNVTNNGVIVVDSSNKAAATASGNASVTAAEIDLNGSLSHSGNAAFHGTIIMGAPATNDPLANLAAPSQPSTQFTAGSYSGTLQPGTYVGGITVSGNNSATLQPGIYYLKGGGLTVSGNATVTGTGVMIYVTGTNSTSVSLGGNASVTLTPSTSGTYQGIVLFQDRNSTASISISGNAALNTTGTEYAPGAKVTLSGNDDTDNPVHSSLGSQWIVADLSLGGNAQFSITADANNRSANPNAFMVAGGPVQPAGPLAPLTPAEVNAAFTEALALWSAAGLDAGTREALARATITVEPLPAPYLGLAAPGAIYLDSSAEGYGWFTNVAPSAVPPADKIDLLTVVAHELGHLFGLMDGNGTALMAQTLAAGVRMLPVAGDLLAPHTTLSAGPRSPGDSAGVNGPSAGGSGHVFVSDDPINDPNAALWAVMAEWPTVGSLVQRPAHLSDGTIAADVVARHDSSGMMIPDLAVRSQARFGEGRLEKGCNRAVPRWPPTLPIHTPMLYAGEWSKQRECIERSCNRKG